MKLRKKKNADDLWKNGHTDSSGGLQKCEVIYEEIRNAKAQLELNLATAVRDNKKCFYKYINNKMMTKKSLCPLLDVGKIQ